MTAAEFLASAQFPSIDGNSTSHPSDGTAKIASQLKSGFNHEVSAMWQAERQLHKVRIYHKSTAPGGMLN